VGSEDSEIAELRRIATFFHSIVEHIPDMVFVKDAEALRFVLFNRAGEQLLGIPGADVIGKTDYDLFPADEAEFFRAKDMETIARGEVVEIPEEPLLTRARGERVLHTKKIVLTADDGTPKYLLGISHDITERRAAEKELEKLRAAVAAAVIHDFRTPLQAILSGTEILAGRTAGDQVARDTITQLRAEVARLVRLSNDMLDATRVAIEDVSIEPEVVDLVALTSAIVHRYRPRIATRCVEVKTPVAVPPIAVDPVRLEQILHNLLENAAKYSPEESPIVVEVGREETGATIRVIDRGVGIEPADLPRVFDRFYQSAGARQRKQGFGLGLFIAKGLVRAHGGRIAVDSDLGRGSTFRVWFPAVT
jgi:PAS domain S-box-containing protein